MEAHIDRVSALSASVRHFQDIGKVFRIYHGTTSTTRRAQFDPESLVDTSTLDQILSINTTTTTAVVEPNVTHGSLADAALAHGLVPKVVPEFPEVTVGGTFCGTGGESSSFKYGYFEHTVEWIEIVLANGNVVTASASQNSDLFYGAATTCGSLGIVTLLCVQLIPAFGFIELRLTSSTSVAAALADMRTACEDQINEYIEGLQFSRQRFVIISGRFTPEAKPGIPLLTASCRRDPWFYLQIEKLTSKKHSGARRVTMPFVDYLFRHNRGAFWAGQLAFEYFRLPFNRVTRLLADNLISAKKIFHILHEANFGERFVVQDAGVPWAAADTFLEYVNTTFSYYPVWLCPFVDPYHDKPTLLAGRGYGSLSLQYSNEPKTSPRSGLMLNVGIYGPGISSLNNFLMLNRDLERQLKNLGGQKGFYACAYYTEDEFWDVYDRDWYTQLRIKYGATSLLGVYEKMVNTKQLLALGLGQHAENHSEADQNTPAFKRPRKKSLLKTRPFPGIYGVWKAMLGQDYLLSRRRRLFASSS